MIQILIGFTTSPNQNSDQPITWAESPVSGLLANILIKSMLDRLSHEVSGIT